MDGTVATPAGRLHFRIDGPDRAPPVLLSNALGTTLEMWSAQVERLCGMFRIIRYDTRGHGRSSVPAGDYTLDDLGEDVVRVLHEAGVDHGRRNCSCA